MSDKNTRIFGGDRQTLMQNLHQAVPEVEDGIRMVWVQFQVVDLLGDGSQLQDTVQPVTHLKLHKLQWENSAGRMGQQ